MSVTGLWAPSELPKLTSFFSAPEASLSERQYRVDWEAAQSLDLLQIDLDSSFRIYMLRLCRHVEVDLVTELVDRC